MLTDREEEVLRLVTEGLPNKIIARRLGISERTVKAHLTHIFQRLGVSDRTQAALWATRRSSERGREYSLGFHVAGACTARDARKRLSGAGFLGLRLKMPHGKALRR